MEIVKEIAEKLGLIFEAEKSTLPLYPPPKGEMHRSPHTKLSSPLSPLQEGEPKAHPKQKIPPP